MWWLATLEYCYNCKTPVEQLSVPQLKERVKEAKIKMNASNLRRAEKCVKCPSCGMEVSPATFKRLREHVASQSCKDKVGRKAINMIKSGSCEHGGTTLDVSYCLSICNRNHASEERCYMDVALKKVKRTSKVRNVKAQSDRPQGAGTAKRRRNFMDRQKEKRQAAQDKRRRAKRVKKPVNYAAMAGGESEESQGT